MWVEWVILFALAASTLTLSIHAVYAPLSPLYAVPFTFLSPILAFSSRAVSTFPHNRSASRNLWVTVMFLRLQDVSSVYLAMSSFSSVVMRRRKKVGVGGGGGGLDSVMGVVAAVCGSAGGTGGGAGDGDGDGGGGDGFGTSGGSGGGDGGGANVNRLNPSTHRPPSEAEMGLKFGSISEHDGWW